MDIEELNRSLTAITESERSYRENEQSGLGTDIWQQLKVSRTPEGLIRLPEDILLSRSYGTSVGRGRKPLALDGRFYLRKHSRFNPTPEHVHSYIEMSYVYHGMCRQHINGRDVTLLENQVLLLDSDCPHAIDALGTDDIMISICLDKTLLDQTLDMLRNTSNWLTDFLVAALDEQADHNRYVRFHSEKNRRVRRFFQELMCEYFDPSPNAEHIVLGLFQLVLAELVNVYENDYVQREQRETGSSVSSISLLRHIQENYLTCSLESVAECFFVSPNYVSKLLKQATGKTYMQLVQEQRLSHAAALLRAGSHTVDEAARAVGYENASFFYRKFKVAYGMTPAEYRKNKAK